MARTEEEVSTATQRGGADDADRLAKDVGSPVPEPRRKRRMPFFVELYRADIGKKWVMAITGIVLMGYVFAHMVGNLHVFEGARQIDHYGEWLRDLLDPPFPRTMVLWLLRVTIVVALTLHIHAAYALSRVNWRARGGLQRYQSSRDYVAANFAARTMRWTGIIVGLFLVFHILDLTWGTANPGFVRGQVYRNTIASFERVPVAVAYIAANVALGVHLYHGGWSLFQSVGWNNPRFNLWRRYFAVGFSVVVTAGFISVPIAVQAGWVS
ncbi:MAG: succinate dehydrogenase cytochrome b subunit [Actinomycetota bacterium]|nr:succinate dehydrogenase cytochrome b subunit [Actinomycetota bacterium]